MPVALFPVKSALFSAAFGVARQPITLFVKGSLPLALLMLGVFADDQDSAFSFNDFALVANRFY